MKFIVRVASTTLLLVGWAVGPTLLAAEAKKISVKKRVVLIDDGKDGGFEKGASVCFFKDSTKIGCGVVVKAISSKAFVRVKSLSVLRKIRRGMKVELQEGKVPSSSKPPYFMAFRLYPSLMFAGPAKYNTLTFFAPDDPNGTAETVWNQVESRSISVGGGGELEFSFGPHLSLALGGRYHQHCKLGLKTFCAFEGLTDYVNDPQLDNLYVQVQQSSKVIGAYIDMYFYKVKFTPNAWLGLGSGVDVDLSTVTLQATRLDKTEALEPIDLAIFVSKKTIISLRLLPQFNFYFGGLGMTLAANMLVPVSMSGEGEPDTDADLDRQVVGGEAGKDLTLALGHTKSSFAAELIMSVYFAF